MVGGVPSKGDKKTKELFGRTMQVSTFQCNTRYYTSTGYTASCHFFFRRGLMVATDKMLPSPPVPPPRGEPDIQQHHPSERQTRSDPRIFWKVSTLPSLPDQTELVQSKSAPQRLKPHDTIWKRWENMKNNTRRPAQKLPRKNVHQKKIAIIRSTYLIVRKTVSLTCRARRFRQDTSSLDTGSPRPAS